MRDLTPAELTAISGAGPDLEPPGGRPAFLTPLGGGLSPVFFPGIGGPRFGGPHPLPPVGIRWSGVIDL